MPDIIGVDFGNTRCYPSFIMDMNQENRTGGDPKDLLPGNCSDGIPSMYFYSATRGERLGQDAVSASAAPQSNRINLLKRRIGQSITLDGKVIACNDMITKLAEYVIRQANKRMEENFRTTSNEIALAYPVDYSFDQLQVLINLVEKATLRDGRHVRVVGTIREPAAAALDYLSQFGSKNESTTVLVYDLGGGTFDLALVAAHPSGRTLPDGTNVYYDIIDMDGDGQLGGHEFDQAMYNLFLQKTGVTPVGNEVSTWEELAEGTKVELSDVDTAWPGLVHGGMFLNVEITVDEYNAMIQPLVARTVEMTRRLLAKHPDVHPSYILLTGGQSQTPLVKQMLEAALPEYAGRVDIYRPSKAISYGAARYGVIERPTDDLSGAGTAVVRRTMFDLGVNTHSLVTGKEYVSCLISAGTTMPTPPDRWNTYETLEEGQRRVAFTVYEAKVDNPVKEQIKRDYNALMSITLNFGRSVPKGKKVQVSLYIENDNTLHIVARDPEDLSNVETESISFTRFA